MVRAHLCQQGGTKCVLLLPANCGDSPELLLHLLSLPSLLPGRAVQGSAQLGQGKLVFGQDSSAAFKAVQMRRGRYQPVSMLKPGICHICHSRVYGTRVYQKRTLACVRYGELTFDFHLQICASTQVQCTIMRKES